ncbi:hypothetical protein [Streptomyces sp. NPDC093984]|uniref:hypothetical protein n=1 Tax=Streptomyces sp. NPDC093984 TaxID=3366052 RepID=UPI00380C824E
MKSTICGKGGYTKSIRPPVSITSREKRLNAASYGYTGRLGDAEYDHLLSGVATVYGRFWPRQGLSGMLLRRCA